MRSSRNDRLSCSSTHTIWEVKDMTSQEGIQQETVEACMIMMMMELERESESQKSMNPYDDHESRPSFLLKESVGEKNYFYKRSPSA